MAWLTGWSKRLKMEIDELRIDENLTNFPVMIALSSGTGLNSFNAGDVFDTITPISGTVFSEDFTASGTNWTHVTGTTTYNGSYASQSRDAVDYSTYSYDLGKYWEVKCRMYNGETNLNNLHTSTHFGYDDVTSNYALRIQLSNSTSYSQNYVRVAKNTGTFTILITDTTYNYFSDTQTWYCFRARREGTKFYFKVWKYLAGEPTTWGYELENAYNDSDLTSGRIMISNGTCNNSRFDDIMIQKHYPITTSKKLAITSEDGTTQLPVEIEYWDQYDKKGYLWTKIPTVYSGTNTTFYLYYDVNQSDNVPYVGYTDSTIAQTVWDSNYTLVCHMNIHPSKGYVKDSTAYNVDSTSFGPDYNNWQLTQAGLSYTLDGATADDSIAFGYNNVATNISGAITVENIYKAYTGTSSVGRFISAKGIEYSVAKKSWGMNIFGNGPYRLAIELSNTGFNVPSYNYGTTAKFDLNVWYYGAFKFNPSTETTLWVNNGAEIRSTSSVPSSLYVNPSPTTGDTLYVGVGYSTTNAYAFDGEISEFRVSKIARSDAWLKATYYTCFNQLMNFSSESAPSYYYQGYVKEKGSAVARAVKLYRRSTGVLVDYTTSASGNGYYYLTTPYNEDHFVVAFDDEAGDEYNALILDRLDPTGIE